MKILCIWVAAGILGLIFGKLLKGCDDDHETPTENKDGGGVYVYSILKAAYFGLIDQGGAKCFGFQKHGAVGFGPWIASCLKRFEMGEDVPASVALTALEWTRRELMGGRFDISGLDDAILRLEEMTRLGA